jgi:hypothetical protein
MGVVYSGQCGQCGHTDGTTNGHLALRLDNGEFVGLWHPVEIHILEKQGFTWKRAVDEHRIVGVALHYCMECGTRNEKCSLHEPESLNCTATLCIWIGIVTLSALFLPFDVPVNCLIGLGLMYLYQHIAGWIRERRRASRPVIDVGLPDLTKCSYCDGEEFEVMREGKPLVCPVCHLQAFVYKSWGMS